MSETKAATKLISYIRVSTRKQGSSGLGLDGQRAAVAAYAAGIGAVVIAEYREVESGTNAARPELGKAIAHAELTGARLVIAKLDRLSRNVHFLSGLMESKVDFVCCDNPNATRLTVHILAAVAEDEAGRISQRTKAALAAYRAGKRVSKRVRDMYPDGVPADVVEAVAGKLGAELEACRNLDDAARRKGHERGTAAASALAADRAAKVRPIAAELREQGLALAAVAAELNRRGYVTRRGLPWTHVAVLRLLDRAGTGE